MRKSVKLSVDQVSASVKLQSFSKFSESGEIAPLAAISTVSSVLR